MKAPYNIDVEILLDLFDLKKSSVDFNFTSLPDNVLTFYNFGKNAVAIQKEDVTHLFALQAEVSDILLKPGALSPILRRSIVKAYCNKLPESIKGLHSDIKNITKILKFIKQADKLYHNPTHI